MKTSETITSQTTRYNYVVNLRPQYSQKSNLFLGSVIYLKTTSPVIIYPVITDDDIMMKTALTTAKLCSIIQFKNLVLSMSRSTGQMK